MVAYLTRDALAPKMRVLYPMHSGELYCRFFIQQQPCCTTTTAVLRDNMGKVEILT